MKKTLLLLVALICCNLSFSQIYVKDNSFHKIEGYVMLDKSEHYDLNDRPMALIKISTQNITAEERSKFYFKGNLATSFDVQFKTSEIYLYLSTAATFIEIHHPDFSKIEYKIPEDLCDFCGYEMVIVNGNKETVKPQIDYFIINTDQPNAMIYIDDEYVGRQEVKKTYNVGSVHTYRIECDLYHTEEGTVTIKDKVFIDKKLRPAFGYINIITQPQSGANIFIDGKYIGVSPCMTEKLKSGAYTIKAVKEMFNTTEQTFTVTDGNTTEAVLNMSSDYITINISTDAESDIYIDNVYKGRGSWTGLLQEGSHYVEARKASHNSTFQTINITKTNNETIVIEAPQPIYGYLNIDSSPYNADIYIDGKYCGKTPDIIENIIVGEHELVLKKEGYSDLKRNIRIKDGETLSLNETLVNGKETVVVTNNIVEPHTVAPSNVVETKTVTPKNNTKAKEKEEVLIKTSKKNKAFWGVNAAVFPELSVGADLLFPVSRKLYLGARMGLGIFIYEEVFNLRTNVMFLYKFKNDSGVMFGAGIDWSWYSWINIILGYKSKGRLYYNVGIANGGIILFQVGFQLGKK